MAFCDLGVDADLEVGKATLELGSPVRVQNQPVLGVFGDGEGLKLPVDDRCLLVNVERFPLVSVELDADVGGSENAVDQFGLG